MLFLKSGDEEVTSASLSPLLFMTTPAQRLYKTCPKVITHVQSINGPLILLPILHSSFCYKTFKNPQTSISIVFYFPGAPSQYKCLSTLSLSLIPFFPSPLLSSLRSSLLSAQLHIINISLKFKINYLIKVYIYV